MSAEVRQGFFIGLGVAAAIVVVGLLMRAL